MEIKDLNKLTIPTYYSGEVNFDKLLQELMSANRPLWLHHDNATTLMYALENIPKEINLDNVYVGYLPYSRDDKDMLNITGKGNYRRVKTFLPPHNNSNLSHIEWDKTIWNENMPKGDIYIAADKSAAAYAPENIKSKLCVASKIRNNRKVVSVDIKGIYDNMDIHELRQKSISTVVIFDDILGGGATIDKIIAQLPYEVKQAIVYVGYSEGLYSKTNFSWHSNHNVDIKVIALQTKGEQNENWKTR